jgi:hypothetical protein
VVVALQQNHARGRLAVLRHCCQRHCIHLTDPNLHCRGKPNSELLDRIGIEINAPQTFGEIFFAQGDEIER